MKELQFFDRKQAYSVAWKALPHWAQAGTNCFITWRTADSLPVAAERRITRQRTELIQRLGLATNGDWQTQLARLPAPQRHRARWLLFTTMDRELDRRFGECLLANPDCSRIVEESLLHFDNDRYFVTDFVVMPNHVHVLVAFRDEDLLLTQCESWKRYSARKLHQLLKRTGEFWQVDQFDHLVRGPDQFEYFRQYIADNPKKAGLEAESYRYYSKDL